ncbi:glycosyltransferase family 2 protein [Candidatus Nitrotoga sp. 1052]|uniref:glycosyltransferase family 2 protein n=1 Tax=Candidatus Nitrotoga sp. 1052 TaxID=2886964 RepID=UPI001EF58A2A|nr:glycosyltransferase family 2 protein [Candidatus Nitrotoga sp. 1052]CAH1077438.1 Glycosyltransferase family 2 protein [Candidatus Nitrotoga sp. 1052]
MNKNNSSITSLGQRKRVSVVVPVYQNRETVSETCLRILQVREQSFPHLDIEIVFVDDGSQDGSWEELERVRAGNPDHVSLVKLSRNFGQVSAILAGYEAAQGDAVITISADLQDPVGVMVQMVSQWETGQEIVIAHRESRDDDVAATLFSRIAYGFARRANPRIPAGGFDYLLLSYRATKLLRSFNGRHRFFQGDVLWLGLPTVFIPYARERRTHGKSGWTFAKKFKYFTDLILDSSYLPIRLMSSLGFLTASAGLIYAVVIVGAWFQGQTPFAGWAPIMVTLLIVGGLIMMMLGIIGEYLWRIYDDVKERPLYIVERQLPMSGSRSSQFSTSSGTDCYEKH